MPTTYTNPDRLSLPDPTTYDELVSAVNAVVDHLYSGHVASAVKRGKNPKYPYLPLIKNTDKYGVTRTQNPTRKLAYATREEAIAVAQRILDGYRSSHVHNLLRPSHRADREWRGLPRDINALLDQVGKLTVAKGSRVVMVYGKHEGQQGTVRGTAGGGLTHWIDLDNGQYIADAEAVDFDVL